MPTVYWQGPAGRTELSLERSATPEGSTTEEALAETSRAGLYKASDDDAAEGDTATILNNAVPYEDGVIETDAAGLLWVIKRGVNRPTQPYSSHAPQRVVGTKLTAFLNEHDDVSLTVTCYDADGDLLPLDGLSLVAIVASADDPETPLFTPQSFTGSGSTFSLVLNTAATSAVALAGQAHHWSLREGTKVIQRGRLEVVATAST